jgi:hypothetical protein
MKAHPKNNLLSKLKDLHGDLKSVADPAAKTAIVANLDAIIASLSQLRSELANHTVEARVTQVQAPLAQIIDFLEFAKTDESLKTFLCLVESATKPKEKRAPIEIPGNLTNDQIRALLAQNLSVDELKAIARQRAISTASGSGKEIRASIVKNLERQEGYGRLANP